LQIAASFGEGSLPIDLPTRGAVEAPGAPIEIWVHQSLIGDASAAAIDRLGAQVDASDLVKVVSAVALLAGGGADISSQLRLLLGDQPIRMQKVGQWRVIEWDLPLGALPSIARAQAPRSTGNSSPAIARVERQSIPKQVASPVPMPGHRIWTSGQYTANAEFLSLDGNIVRLRRTTGVRTSIPLAKLSAADQEWLRAHLANR
jgi:hypothetical protein